MISKYQTIPAEEETLSAAQKKQNGGRKVAGALLAFALAAGLMASAAGRNRGATYRPSLTLVARGSTSSPIPRTACSRSRPAPGLLVRSSCSTSATDDKFGDASIPSPIPPP